MATLAIDSRHRVRGPRDEFARLVRRLLELLGEDPGREGLLKQSSKTITSALRGSS